VIRNAAAMRSQLVRRNASRDVAIRQFGRLIDQWTSEASRRILGGLVASSSDPNAAMRDFDREAARFILAAPSVMEQGLRGVLDRVWGATVDAWLAVVPVEIWARRSLAADQAADQVADQASYRAAGQTTTEDIRTPPPITVQSQYARILLGEIDRAAAKRLVRQFEFPPPSAETVDRILRATAAPDGLSAMERIVTVAQRDLGALREAIVANLSHVQAGDASALNALSVDVRRFLGEQEGVNYKARRIARTESMRVAETLLREADERATNLFDGYRTFTANDNRVREEHSSWHNKLFRRTATGQYIADDGEHLPDFPAGPNCRCWSTPELRDDIESQLPPANLGRAYAQSLARFEGSAAAG